MASTLSVLPIRRCYQYGETQCSLCRSLAPVTQAFPVMGPTPSECAMQRPCTDQLDALDASSILRGTIDERTIDTSVTGGRGGTQ